MYVNGQGVKKDATKGLSWIMKAANQGYKAARLNAFLLCLEEAQQGNAAAMYNVGYMCLNDWGGEHDTNVCINWLDSAAKLGHIRSASLLSQIYTKGMFGITPDEEQVSYWSNLATEAAEVAEQ
jgi:TPR repeat protein